jgi:hypothetical protein
VRKLKQLTDADYDTLRKEAASLDEGSNPANPGGYPSESSATEEYRRQHGILDLAWPDELIATVSRFRKNDFGTHPAALLLQEAPRFSAPITGSPVRMGRQANLAL